MSLTRYRNKRNFRGTPEPEGKDPKKKSSEKVLRFVIQLHDASRKHYDLRLELDGTMKSWAVPKGPSLDPLERRLAVEVEDHPMEYNEFEGVIPSGNYGAGVVMIWDEGSYTARAVDFPAKDAADALRRGYAKGHMTFIMNGEKLKGEFALIRLAKSEGANWLLVKKHDKFASREEITHSDRSVRSGRTLGEIASHSVKEGKVWNSKEKRAKDKEDEKAKAKGTKKKAAPKKKLKTGRKIFQPKAKQQVSEASLPLYKLPNWLPAGQHEALKSDLSHAWPDGYRAQLILDDGKLNLRGKTTMTSRFPDLVQELQTLGGSFLCDGLIVPIDENGLPRKLGRAAAGTPSQYAYMIYDLLHIDGYDLSKLPLKDRLAIAKDIFPESASLLLAPLSDEGEALLIRDGAATDPKGKILRPIARSIHGRVPAAENQVSGSRHTVNNQTRGRGDERVALGNLAKIYWPKDKITKGELIDFYRFIAPYMLPHLKGHAQSLHRHPNGIDAPSFFQKEVAGALPGFMPTATISSGRSGKSVTYALCESEAQLLCLANMGCIEINSWLSRVDAINSPRYIVFDLDPGKIPFEEVIRVAKTVKKILDAIKAPAFIKTSGSRGLHVYVPVKDAESFDEGRLFAQQVSEEVHRLLPDTTSLERSPDRRRDLIYLDYLQNRIGQTMASIYSVRPKPKAPVSVPLRWSEVKKGLDVTSFTIANVPARIKKLGDLWADIADEAVSLKVCQARLDQLLRSRKVKKK